MSLICIQGVRYRTPYQIYGVCGRVRVRVRSHAIFGKACLRGNIQQQSMEYSLINVQYSLINVELCKNDIKTIQPKYQQSMEYFLINVGYHPLCVDCIDLPHQL